MLPLYFSILGCLKFAGGIVVRMVAKSGWFLKTCDCIGHVFCFSNMGVVEGINFLGNMGNLISIQFYWWVFFMILLESFLCRLELMNNIINLSVDDVVTISY